MVHRGTRTADFPQQVDQPAQRSSRPRDHLLRDHVLRDHLLRDHLLREHGRTGRETDGLPLEGLHRFEHVEQAMGLNDLRHQHRQ